MWLIDFKIPVIDSLKKGQNMLMSICFIFGNPNGLIFNHLLNHSSENIIDMDLVLLMMISS